jgi:hypothetical protein
MTPPTFCEVWPPDRFPITFYRYPTAPDWQLAPEDFDGAEVAAAPFLLATGTGLHSHRVAKRPGGARRTPRHGRSSTSTGARRLGAADEYGELA